MKNIDIMILDDHPLVCASVTNLLKPLSYISNILSVTNGKEALSLLRKQKIDFIIIDIDLGISDGFDFFCRIKSHGYTGKVLFISANKENIYSDTALSLGANGYICKSENLSVIKDAVDSIISGYDFFKFDTNLIKSGGKIVLSRQEKIVLHYLLDGKTNKEISEMLSLSSKTISTYKRRILDKHKVKNIIELVNFNKRINNNDGVFK
ncbi:response regulator transcription factor [Aliivibrio fischeri]|uniref:response regulator transcription factor n=1 Tax=Aliivibrio fischeri TaxID=668 RepID=UPI0012DA0B9F|nr:response regulator transcription factor [Aliivibrio fischeri]MUJ36724.1 response regulator [Aliivibrio fischeri]